MTLPSSDRADLIVELRAVTAAHGDAQGALSTALAAYSTAYARAYLDLVSPGVDVEPVSATAADRLAKIHARAHQQMIDVARGDIARLVLEHATLITLLGL